MNFCLWIAFFIWDNILKMLPECKYEKDDSFSLNSSMLFSFCLFLCLCLLPFQLNALFLFWKLNWNKENECSTRKWRFFSLWSLYHFYLSSFFLVKISFVKNKYAAHVSMRQTILMKTTTTKLMQNIEYA